MKVFSIYDSKAEAYLRPFYEASRGSAIRAVTDALSDDKCGFSKHPGDFTLFELGSFDENAGAFHLYDAIVNLGVLVEFVTLANMGSYPVGSV